SFSGRRVINTGLNSLIEGYPINTLWGYQTNGYFSTADEVKASAFQDSRTGPGDVRYIDRNGDGRITLGKGSVEDFGDMVLIGSDQPRLLFGATIGFDWKGFDFMAFFQGVGERYFRPTVESIAPRLVTWKQPIAIHADYWTPENPNAFYPRPFTGATHNYLASDKWTLNGRYMRLKNLQFGYTIPNKLTQKLNLSKVRVFFSGQDLATWSALKQFAGYYDPENRNNVENDYPFFSSATGGLNISF
ncbi:MAG: SusC/RagA family TonB-linked outer membrane protein, partial [Runella slithyformis]